jgi:predicted secreted protein
MALSAVLSKDMLISIGSNVIGFATDFDFEVNKQTIDITKLSSAGWKEFLVDLKEWKVSTSGMFTRGTPGANETGSPAMLASLIGSDAVVTISIKTAVTGDQYVTGSAYITSFKNSGSVGDKIKFSADFQGTGAFTLPTV